MFWQRHCEALRLDVKTKQSFAPVYRKLPKHPISACQRLSFMVD
jgi:hypothetical protein